MSRSVVFDLDGTLLDSALDILSALERAALREGLRGLGTLTRAMIGPPVTEILERWGPPMSDEERGRLVAAFRYEYDSSLMTATRPYAGADACISSLRSKGMALYVATNKPAAPTSRLLDQWFPEAFTGYATIDSIAGRRLTKLQMLTLLVERHAIDPRGSVMVGDSAADLRAGRSMGWRTVAALHGYGTPAELEAEAPDWRVQNLAELPAILERT